MKHIIDNDAYEAIVKNLRHAESIACVMACNSDLEQDEANVFWAVKDLIANARLLVYNSEISSI